MKKTNNSLASQLDETNRLHTNGLAIFEGFMQAITTKEETAVIKLFNADGSFSEVTVPSNLFLGAEVERLRQTILNMSGLLADAPNSIVSLDDTTSFREIFASNYKRAFDAALRSEITVNGQVTVAENDIIDKLISPLTTVDMTIDSRFLEAQRLRYTKFVLADPDALSSFSDGDSYAETIQKLSGLNYTRVDSSVDLTSRVSRFYGDFSVIEVVDNSDDTFTISLDKITYSDIENVVQDSRELSVNDKLVSDSGLVQLSVQSVDIPSKKVTILREAGYEQIPVGIDALSFLYVDPTETRNVKIPLKLNEKSILFLSIVKKTTDTESAYSEAIILDSDTFVVVEDNTEFTFNEYFAAKVVDIGKFFESFIRENAIPASLGIQPDKPAIKSTDFSVVQINKHITDTPETEKLKNLQKEKATVYSEIQRLNDKIQRLNTKIIAGNYKSTADKDRDVATRDAEVSKKEKKSELFRTIVNDINTAMNAAGLQNSSKKYKVRGFWEVGEDTVSPTTAPQKIVQYIVRYRYVSNNSDVSEAQSIPFTDSSGSIVNGLFSTWNEFSTNPLQKIVDDDGNITWGTNSVQDAEQQNINQLDISINFGESVQIQVRAISEAGYPTSPVLSAWSNVAKVEFPEELLIGSDLETISSENEEDLLKVQINQEFAAQGITKHIQNSISEQDTYFSHPAKEISSGFLTSEQKIISLFDYITSLEQRLLHVEEKLDRRISVITVELLGLDSTVYSANNASQINLFAGYYTNSVDLANNAEYGTIVETTFFLRLQNNNATVVEMQSLSPGSLTIPTEDAKYTDVPISTKNNQSGTERQFNGQVVYVRNEDKSGNDKFYIDTDEVSETVVSAEDRDDSAAATDKLLVEREATNTFSLVASLPTAKFEQYVVISKSHPLYVDYIANNASVEDLETEFTRLSALNSLLRQDNVQNTYSTTRTTEFLQNDKYAVGKNSIGSKLYVRLSDQSTIQVNGVDSSNVLEIQSGSSEALLIPIVFQFRMSDALGNVAGDTTLNTNSNFTYTKSLGIDMIVGANDFKFDVNVSATFRPTSVSNDDTNIQAVKSNIDTLSSAQVKIA